MDEVVAYTQTVGGVTKRYYPHYNHLYSVAALTDGTTGMVVERFTYDAYGKQKITDASGNVTRAKSSVGWDRGFTGYITDNETGLLHARTRMYSPALGRFIERTPWMAIGDWYVSSYSMSNLDAYWRRRMYAFFERGYGTYRDGRYSTYDAFAGDPANRVEPFSEAPTDPRWPPPVIDPHALAQLAQGFEGDARYGLNGTVDDDYDSGKWKCNKFVYDVFVGVGLYLPKIGGLFGGDPPSAKDWGKCNVEYFYIPLDGPKPGDVATDGEHVGIVVGNGLTASAAKPGVVVNDWGFRPGQQSGKRKIIFLRYRCFVCTTCPKPESTPPSSPSSSP